MAKVTPILMKMGGSVVTFREKPLAANVKAIEGVARSIAAFGHPVVIIHGGGSFGHYYAEMFGVSTTPKITSPEAASKIHAAMLQLNLIITDILAKCGVPSYTVPPIELIDGEDVTESGHSILADLLKLRISPITFGDVLPSKRGFFILSGDVITRVLAEALRPSRVVFSIDVDGIYPVGSQLENMILELDSNVDLKLAPGKGSDVTGGMALKIQESFKIAKHGIDVFFVNGLKPERVLKALKGQRVYGTRIRGAKSGG